MGEKVTITISPDGTPTIHVEGHAGPGCKDLTKALEKALGKVTSDKATADFAAAEVKHVNANQ